MKRPRQVPLTFNEVLSAAIDDLIEHGFDSMQRVDRWAAELRAAAERSLTSQAQMERMLRGAMEAIYRRMVERGGAFKFNDGVARFTIDKVKPALRAELDRRILASANLIKLNREQAIEKTLQRFQGWATSIPKDGTAAAKKREVKADAKKAMGSLPFEERRVIVDQGHKLTAAINEIIAADGGAIALTWRSNWRQPGYNYREDHKERDGNIYLIRDSWAHKAGLVKTGDVGFYDKITAVGEEVFCRCYAVYHYHLKDLPENMLTAKGKAALNDVQNSLEIA